MPDGPVIANNTPTGTLGLLLLAKEAECLPTISGALDALQEAGMHLKPSLVDKVRAMAGESPY